jgi:hypothetical protein
MFFHNRVIEKSKRRRRAGYFPLKTTKKCALSARRFGGNE